jgi:malonyl-CoA O-methyltransferase
MKWLKAKKEVPVLTALEGYNLWASSYSNESNPIKNLSDSFVEKFLPDLTDKIVLDAGCGTGKFCRLAEEKRASKIVGLDLSPAMIKEAQLSCRSTEFICSEISTAPLKESHYDVIICALVLGHIADVHAALENLLRGLKSGGSIIITDFHPFLTLARSKRTFKDKSSGKTYEVQHHLHMFTDYFECFKKHNVRIENFEEPLFQGNPVVFGIRGVKS